MPLFRRKKKEVDSKTQKALRSRLDSLDDAMERLLREHMTPQSINELFDYIPMYVPHTLSKSEFEYCKEVLQKKAYKGFLRYDDERLD